MTDNFTNVLHYLEAGHNLFITGVAGSGKSHLLRQLKEKFRDKLQLTATTGISAINIDGTTIHSWARLGIGNLSAQRIVGLLNKDQNALSRILNCKYLAIDEISMFSDKMLTLLHQVLVLARSSSKPFGGVQLILFGDFLQLPPVLQKEECLCLGSAIWQIAQIRSVLLTTNYRQKGDITFYKVLSDIRKGQNLEQCYEVLKTRINQAPPKDITKLVSTREVAKQINEDFLGTLNTPLKVFKASYEAASEKEMELYKKTFSDMHEIHLKVGAKVMLTYNVSLKEGLINGLVGHVTGYNNDNPIVEFENGASIEVKPRTWEVLDAEGEQIFACTQVPLQLAWATTIHKSQGCTFTRLHADLSKCFAPGQAYVALSRVTSLDGLYLEPFQMNVMRVDQNMVAYYNYLEQAYTAANLDVGIAQEEATINLST